MPTSNYTNGFPNGVTMRDVPVIISQNGDGAAFWVDNVKGSNGNRGSFKFPFGTIDYAVGRCTADRGDMIFVAAGHTESVIAAAGLDLDIAGITIIFLGEGSNRGAIDFGTVVGADMDVDAANITMINPRFTASLDALTGPIDVNAANFKVYGAEYVDGTSIDTTDALVADANATGLVINGWRYIVGDEGGTQKQSHIQLNGVDNALLSNIDVFGDFATGNIENVTDELLNVRFENIKLRNTNAGPQPGIVLDADSTGFAKNVDIRIASGSTYASSNAKLNWDLQCLGYAGDGTGGDPIGTAGGGTIEVKIDAIQADIGDPSGRTNFQNLEDMIGIPDAVNSNLDDMLRTGFDSSATTSSADGSVMERLEFIQQNVAPDLGGYVVHGTCNSAMGASTTVIVCAELDGYGDDLFNTKYYMQVIKNDNSVGAAPELEIRQITDYVSATGTFTVTAFTVNVEANDKILVMHESVVMVGRDDADNVIATTNVVANADGSVLERQESIQVSAGLNVDSTTTDNLHGKLGTDTELADRSMFDLLGGDGFAAYPASAAPANDVSLAEVAGAIYDDTNTISGISLPAAPVANSLAAFIASGGTGLGTELADSVSIVDAIGSDGAALAYGAGSALGAIGTSFWLKKSVVSSTITFAAAVDITGVSSVGELAIEQVIVKTDATGLATGTNFEIKSDNANGLANIFVEAIAALGANKTVELSGASVTSIPSVIEVGKKLQVQNTVADGTGAGVIDIYVKVTRLTAGATIAVV